MGWVGLGWVQWDTCISPDNIVSFLIPPLVQMNQSALTDEDIDALSHELGRKDVTIANLRAQVRMMGDG